MNNIELPLMNQLTAPNSEESDRSSFAPENYHPINQHPNPVQLQYQNHIQEPPPHPQQQPLVYVQHVAANDHQIDGLSNALTHLTAEVSQLGVKVNDFIDQSNINNAALLLTCSQTNEALVLMSRTVHKSQVFMSRALVAVGCVTGVSFSIFIFFNDAYIAFNKK